MILLPPNSGVLRARRRPSFARTSSKDSPKRPSGRLEKGPYLVAGTWSVTGGMSTARSVQTGTLLPNGMFLVAGGISGDDYLASAEYTTLPRVLGASPAI